MLHALVKLLHTIQQEYPQTYAQKKREENFVNSKEISDKKLSVLQ